MPRILAILFAVLLPLLSCGGTSNTPSSAYPAIAGTWSGTMQTASRGTLTVTLNLYQQDGIVTGSWTSPSDWSGAVSGTVTTQGSFTGSLTVSAPNADGSRCSGSGTFGGAFTTGRFSAASPGFSGGCATDITLLTQRQ